jgi:putative membrane protein
MSGILGLLVFSLPNLQNSLFPLLSGLYGISTLIYSLSEDSHVPKQKDQKAMDFEPKKSFLLMLFGNIGAFLTSTFPGLSSSIAAMFVSQVYKNIGDSGFLILVGGIGTSSFVLSLATLLAIEKARNGAILVVLSIFPKSGAVEIALMLAGGLIAASISVFLCLKIGKLFSVLIIKMPYKTVVIGIIVFIIVMGYFLCGWIGLLVLLSSTAIGMVPAVVKVKRSQGMGCLILPVILYFLL